MDNEELERLLNEVKEKFPEAATRAKRLMERAGKLDPISITIQVGSERPAEGERPHGHTYDVD